MFFLVEDVQVNSHSTHIEEFIFTEYFRGLKNALEGMHYIIANIGTNVSKTVSTKIDGSPAIFVFWDKNRRFGIAKKSIFNKNPQICYSHEDIDAQLDGDLAKTFHACFDALQKVIVKDGKVHQGDLLFIKDSLKSVSVNGQECWAFHPNTIMYTVPKDSDIGNQIANAKVGVAFHTDYSWDGEDPKTLKVSKFGVKKTQFKPHKDVFLIDTVSNLVTPKKLEFSEAEMLEIKGYLKEALSIGKELDWSILSERGKLSTELKTFINTYIRDNAVMPHPNKRLVEFFEYMEAKVEKEIAKLKTQSAKDKVRVKYQEIFDAKERSIDIEKLFEIFDLLTKAKLMILKKLNDLSIYNNFVLTASGDMVATGDEGFVISKTSAKGAKLVDRYTFSKNNFSKEIVKGWKRANDL